jgi:hypothetical protein
MRFAPLLHALVLFVATLVPAQAAVPFQPADKLFTAHFPATPQTREDTVPGNPGTTFKRLAYAHEGQNHFLMVGVLYVGDGPALDAQEQAALLEGTVDTMVKGMPGMATLADGVTPVTVDGRAGRQIRGTADGTGFFARVFVTGHHMFMVQGLHAPNDPAAKAATEAFVGSFRVAQ